MLSLIPRRRERGAESALARMELTPLDLLRQEFASLFDRAFPTMPFMLEAVPTWGLTVEEGEKEIVVRAEVPGFEASELEVSVLGNVLTLRAEHRETPPAEGAAPVERRSERVERTVTLPAEIEPDKIEARYHNGILEVHIPRVPSATPRRIAVTT
jgi:HSP20 family protein